MNRNQNGVNQVTARKRLPNECKWTVEDAQSLADRMVRLCEQTLTEAKPDNANLTRVVGLALGAFSKISSNLRNVLPGDGGGGKDDIK